MSVARLASLGFAPLVLAALGACAVTPGQPGQGETTAESTAAIVGGTPVATDSLGSVVLLECLTATSSCTFTYGVASWGCTGTQIAPGWILTAHHCVTAGGEALTGGTAVAANTLRVQSQTNGSWQTGVNVYRHPTLDVALIQLGGAITDPSGGVLTTPIYTGADTSLIGHSLYCQGYGVNEEPAESGFGTLRSMSFTVQYAGVGWFDFFPASGGPYLAPGDSGAGCFLDPPGGSAQNYVVATQSYEDNEGAGTPPSDEAEVGADGFESWASGILGTAACASLDASCGTTGDGMGNTVSCGTCGTGDVCAGHQCECAPQACKSPETWSSTDCRCEVKLVCHTPAQCCAQAGGSWSGKYCE
jgi:Trypsin-like peptidase domain